MFLSSLPVPASISFSWTLAETQLRSFLFETEHFGGERYRAQGPNSKGMGKGKKQRGAKEGTEAILLVEEGEPNHTPTMWLARWITK